MLGATVADTAYPANVDLLKQGVFTALIAQDPAAEAKQAIDDLVAFLDTKKKDGIEHDVVIPNVVLTKDTSAADLTKYTYVA